MTKKKQFIHGQLLKLMLSSDELHNYYVSFKHNTVTHHCIVMITIIGCQVYWKCISITSGNFVNFKHFLDSINIFILLFYFGFFWGEAGQSYIFKIVSYTYLTSLKFMVKYTGANPRNFKHTNTYRHIINTLDFFVLRKP